MTSRDTMGLPLRRILALLALLVAAFLPQFSPNQFYVHLGSVACLNLIFVLGLAIIARAGQLSLAHAGFGMLGGYTSALLTMQAGWLPLASVIAAGVLAAGCAAALGWIILRVRGVYFVLVTFSFGQIAMLLALDMSDLTGGANGLVGIPPISVLGHALVSKTDFYRFVFVCALASVLFTWLLYRSAFGDRMAATAENKRLAESSGLDTHVTQVIAFTIGSAMAGIAGALTTHYFRFISPDSFTFWDSVAYLTMLVVGGRAGVLGPLLGVVVLTPLPELLRETQSFQQIIYGAVLVLCLLFVPEGLSSIPRLLRGRWRRETMAAPIAVKTRS